MAIPDPQRETRRVDRLIGLSVYGCALAGVVGIGIAVPCIATGQFAEAASGLLVAAVAFGLLANAVLRK
jgi:hypothetical protein